MLLCLSQRKRKTRRSPEMFLFLSEERKAIRLSLFCVWPNVNLPDAERGLASLRRHVFKFRRIKLGGVGEIGGGCGVNSNWAFSGLCLTRPIGILLVRGQLTSQIDLLQTCRGQTQLWDLNSILSRSPRFLNEFVVAVHVRCNKRQHTTFPPIKCVWDQKKFV